MYYTSSPYGTFYFQLQEDGRVRASVIPSNIRREERFGDLLDEGTLVPKPFGPGTAFFIDDTAKYQEFLNVHFPQGPPGMNYIAPQYPIQRVKDRNVKTVRKQKPASHVIHLRGKRDTYVNEDRVHLKKFNEYFGLFATELRSLHAEKLCFVENEEIFFRAEAIIPEDYVLLHACGRLTEKLLRKITSSYILVFADYDYIGLDSYLLFKELFPRTVLHMPKDYNALYEKYSIPLERKIQEPSKRVLHSREYIVEEIREQLHKNNRFLEQRTLFDDLRSH